MNRFLPVILATAALPAMMPSSILAQQAARKPTVAVLTLDVQEGVTKEESQILSDRLAVELDRTGRFTLINRQRMAEQLALQKFSQLNSCAASECAVEAGRILGAVNMVYGSIGRIGGTYSLNTYLVSVETGGTLQSVSTDIKGGVEEMLTRGIAENAVQLAKPQPASPESGAPNLSTIAVLTLDSRGGIAADEVRLYSDRFAIELDSFRKYTLISRSRMDEVLKEQDFARPDDCSAAECAIEAGRLLGARYMAYGSIGKLGALYTVNTYIVDVETSASVSTATTDFRGSKEDFLTRGMRRNAMNLLGIRVQEGYLNLSVVPGDADLRVNGRSVRAGIVPVPPDEALNITAAAEGYDTYSRTYRVRSGETTVVSIRLERSRGGGGFLPFLPTDEGATRPRRPRVL